MFYENRLSQVPHPNAWVGSGGVALLSRERDFEDGPVAEQNPSLGLAYQQWRAYIKDFTVWLEADNLPKRELLYSPEDTITDISIAFSQNADLHYVWMDAGVGYLRWYDTTILAFATMTLPAGVRTPRLTLDDKRSTQSGKSDIILAYLKADNKLYFRRQRDRFGIEYLLADGPFISLDRMYMNRGMRLQWQLLRGIPSG